MRARIGLVLAGGALLAYVGSYALLRATHTIRVGTRATCQQWSEEVAPSRPGESYGQRSGLRAEHLELFAPLPCLPYRLLMTLEETLLRARLAGETIVFEPPGTLCSAVVHVPGELGPGELRIEAHRRCLDLAAGATTPVLFFEPGGEESMHWLGADRRALTLTFHPQAGHHHELVLPLE